MFYRKPSLLPVGHAVRLVLSRHFPIKAPGLSDNFTSCSAGCEDPAEIDE